MIITMSEISDYNNGGRGTAHTIDTNDPSSTSDLGGPPRSPIFTLESLHDIEELMGLDEIGV